MTIMICISIFDLCTLIKSNTTICNLCPLISDRVLGPVLSLQLSIIELLGHCKGGNFNIHIWAWFSCFICSRWEIRFCLFGKELLSCLSGANVHAFHENCYQIYTKLTFINP